MKKRFGFEHGIRIAGLVGFVLVLTGCVDIFQYVGYDDSGRLNTSVSLKIQKAILEMASGFSGEEPNYEEEFDFSEEEIAEEYPEWVSVDVSPIDTELEYGFRLDMQTAENRMETFDDTTPFIPEKRDSEIVIPLQSMGSENDQGEESAAAFLASSKYRLLISKKYAPTISEAWYQNERERSPVDVQEFDEVYLLEMPVIYLFLSTTPGALHLAY